MSTGYEGQSRGRSNGDLILDVRNAEGVIIAAAIYDENSVEELVAAIVLAHGLAPADLPLGPGWSSPWPHPRCAATRDRARARAATRQAARARRSGS